MKTLSFFHPKSLSNQFFLLSFFFIALIGFDAQSASINWVGANGNSGSRWHEASNWSSRTVPTSNDDVVIPNVKNAPVITTAAACNSITINTGSSLTINSGGNLTVSGNWTNNGTFTQNSGTVTFVGDASVDLGGEANTTFTSLKVNKGNGQSAEVHLKGKGTVEVKSALIIDNGLMKIDTGGALNLSGTAAAPTSGIALNGGTYTINGSQITTKSVKTASVSGNWTSTTTWGGQSPPAADDDVVINSGVTVTMNTSYTSTSTFTINGTGSVQINKGQILTINGSVVMNGNSANSIKNNDGNNGNKAYFTLGSAATLETANTNGVTGINCSIEAGSAGFVVTLPTSANYEFNGTSNQATAGLPSNVNNLTLSGTGTKTLSGTITIGGNLNISTGVTLTTANNVSINGSWNVDGAFSQTAGTTTFSGGAHSMSGSGYSQFNNLTTSSQTINAGSHYLKIAGNWVHGTSGSFVAETSTVMFNGNINQSCSNSTTFIPSFYNLVVDKSGGSLTKRVWNVTNNFEIKSGTFEPTTGTASAFKNVALSGGTFTAPSAFTVAGDWNNTAGTFIAGLGTVTFNGAAQTISGATTFNHLTVAGTDTKTIASTASVTVEGNLTVNNNSTLKIESTGASATGSLIVKGTSTGSGTFSVQRYLPTDNWHLISSPVSGQTLNNFASNNGIQLDGPTQTYDIGPYDEGNDRWSYTSQTSGFEAAKGYSTEKSLNGAGVATFTGNGIYTGSKSIGISRSTTGYGWNCIGNPYTSAILATGTGTNSLLGLNSGQLDPAYAALYFWNNSSGTYDIMTNSGTNYIAVGQGFIVKAKTGGGSISFASSMQSHPNDVTFKDAEIPWPAIILKAKSSDSRSTTMVNFNENMTTSLDPTYDAGMFKTNPKLAIYTKLVGERLPVDFSVQSLPLNETDSYRIPVGVDVPSGGEISFSAEAVNLVGYKVVLEDALTSQLTPMGNEGEGYTTVVPANTTGAGRFYLRVSSSLTGTEPLAKPEFSVFLRDRNIIVNGDAGEQTVFTLCNIEGKQFSQQKATHRNQNIVNAQSLPAGVYLLRIDEPNRHQVAKVMIAQ